MDYKKVDAQCWVEVVCTCPYCGAFEDIFDNHLIRESMGDDHWSYNCDIEITCSECNEVFIVENINF